MVYHPELVSGSIRLFLGIPHQVRYDSRGILFKWNEYITVEVNGMILSSYIFHFWWCKYHWRWK